ncbi:MAG TPA: hypothetical protein VL328_07460 [Gemmatimonadaceae bacterium]|jgi:hypothetical protein|nr:hypothetical protein [Gemmatimonadaceae bacterium]
MPLGAPAGSASSTGSADRAAVPPARGGRAPLGRFEWGALAVYGLVVAVLSALHEPWKDETQTWRLAIDSHGLGALVHNARYEGHPLLFHLILQAVALVSRSWWAVVVLHVVIACAAAWVVMRYAPFTRLEKVLVIAGYYPAYEYAVIVRPYGLGMLLAFASCAAWTAERRRTVLASVLLVLLANTTVLGLLLALALAAAYVTDWLFGAELRPRFSSRQLGAAGAALLAVIVVVALVAKQVIPPADAAYRGDGATVEGASAWSVGAALTIPLRAFTPVMSVAEGTVKWNDWLFDPGSRPVLGLEVLLSVTAVTFGLLVAMRRLSSLVLFVVGTAGFVGFFALFVFGFSRHHGHLVLVWILAVWLARAGPPTRWPAMLAPLAARAQRWAPAVVVASLVPMVVGAAELAVADAMLPFSDARQVASFLRTHAGADTPLIAIARSDAQSVGALLDRPVIYPLDGRVSTFAIWGSVRSTRPVSTRVVGVVDSVLAVNCQAALIATARTDISPVLASHAHLIYETPGRPMSGNRYRVWLASAAPSARCPGGAGR